MENIDNGITNDGIEAVAAAIAMAIHEQTSQVHDVENTTLTIKQAPQFYSPWSSKVHTLRQVPVLVKK